MFRLRNGVLDLLHEPLKCISELHEHGRLKLAAVQITFLCYWQAVRGADPLTNRWHSALPDHDCRVLTAIAHMSAGGGSCFNTFGRRVDPCVWPIAFGPLVNRIPRRHAIATVWLCRNLMHVAGGAASA